MAPGKPRAPFLHTGTVKFGARNITQTLWGRIRRQFAGDVCLMTIKRIPLVFNVKQSAL